MTARTWKSQVTTHGLLMALICLSAGCVLTESAQRPKEQPPPTGEVHQVAADWENRIVVTPDVVNGGTPLVGLAGRLYLFGEQFGQPVLGDGMAVIELCDVARLDQQGKPQLLERWEIDRTTLKRLVKKDMIGWGYTLFLPWQTYRPDLGRVQLQVRFLPDKGLPLFSPPSLVALRNDPQLTVTQRLAPAESVTRTGATLPPAPAVAAPQLGRP